MSRLPGAPPANAQSALDMGSLLRLQRLQVATDMCPDTDRRELLLLRQQCMVDAAAKSSSPQEAHSLSSVHTALTYQMAENRERAAKSSHEASSGPKLTAVPASSSLEALVHACPALRATHLGSIPPPALARALEAAQRVWTAQPTVQAGGTAQVAWPPAVVPAAPPRVEVRTAHHHPPAAACIAQPSRPPATQPATGPPPQLPPYPPVMQVAPRGGGGGGGTNPAWASAKRKTPSSDEDDEVVIIDDAVTATGPAQAQRKGRARQAGGCTDDIVEVQLAKHPQPGGQKAARAAAAAAAPPPSGPTFMTAAQKYAVDQAKKGGGSGSGPPAGGVPPGGAGAGIRAPFQPPGPKPGPGIGGARPRGPAAPGQSRAMAMHACGEDGGAEHMHGLPPVIYARICPNGEPVPDAILKCEPHLVERICGEVLEAPRTVTWDDIAGLEHAKAVVQEVAVWPLKAPHLFKGARSVPGGLLLFGPPGTGKTLLGRAIASQAGATFFSISASSLGSKWIGEGEKLVRALFAVAGALSPSVVFVDEIDSLLTARGDGGEHESSRRLKTELLVQMEGVTGGQGNDDSGPRVLLVGATNRPQELDEAARRRLAKQVYIPLPCAAARRQIVVHMLGGSGSASQSVSNTLSNADLDKLCAHTDGYSGSDMKHLVQEAARAPLRELRAANVDLSEIKADGVRPITLQDFRRAAKQVRPSVTAADIAAHEEWNKKHGAQAGGKIGTEGGDESDGEW